MHIDEGALARALGGLAQHQFDSVGLTEAFHLIVGAMPGLFALDGAGVLLLDDQQDLRYAASTDRGAQILEAVQAANGRGPCVSAIIEDTIVTVEDIQTDERWPDLGDVLAANGIRGVIGAPIHVTGTPIGSLNVYHREPHRWDESEVSALLAFDRIAEKLLAGAVLNARNETLVEQLNRALANRINIDRAVGVLMGREDLDAVDAFERIRRAARSSRTPVREIAEEVLRTKKLP